MATATARRASQQPPLCPLRRRKSQQAEREYEKIRSQLEGLEESVRDRCKKEFTGAGRGGRGEGAPSRGAGPGVTGAVSPSPSPPDLMIEMEDQTNDVHEAGIPVLDYKTYTDRVFFLPSKDGDKDVMITGKLDIPESRRPVVEQALYQFSNLLNSKSFLINVSGGAGRPGGHRWAPAGGWVDSAGADPPPPVPSSSTPWRTSASSRLAPRCTSRRC